MNPWGRDRVETEQGRDLLIIPEGAGIPWGPSGRDFGGKVFPKALLNLLITC